MLNVNYQSLPACDSALAKLIERSTNDDDMEVYEAATAAIARTPAKSLYGVLWKVSDLMHTKLIDANSSDYELDLLRSIRNDLEDMAEGRTALDSLGASQPD